MTLLVELRTGTGLHPIIVVTQDAKERPLPSNHETLTVVNASLMLVLCLRFRHGIKLTLAKHFVFDWCSASTRHWPNVGLRLAHRLRR